MAKKDRAWQQLPRETLRVREGFSIKDFDFAGTPGFTGHKNDGEYLLKVRGKHLSDLQEQLFAEGRAGGTRSVLLVLQGMDTAGKGGTVRHVLGMVDPQGVQHHSFGVPTVEERSHHFLWRIERALPSAGKIGVFDRSHYEDVLVVRVHDLVSPDVWGTRYDDINAWEQRRIDEGTHIIKCALMVSPREQLERLSERLDRPDKHWKFNPGDIDERGHWDAYMEAYQAMFDRCSTDAVPWYAIPADRKWFARMAVTELLTATLEDMGLEWPAADFDIEAQKARIAALRR